MPSSGNEATIRRLVAEFWDAGNEKVLDEVFASNFVNHHPPAGSAADKDGLIQANVMIRGAFSDHRTTIDSVISEGDKVAWRWTFHGVNTGSFAGMPPTGKEVNFSGISIDRFDNGQIVERWSEIDFLGMMQQLGVVPSPEQSGN